MNYIQQAYTGNLGMWKYLIIPIFFFGLMALNYIAIIVLELDVEELMKAQIEEKGTNRFLIENLVPLAVGLVAIFLWVKFVHQQTITSLTTARKKVDWKRIFFAFFLWGLITAIFVFIDYKISPENYVFNFNLEPFLKLAAIGILLIPLQTSFEEYLFRGYLMQGIGVAVKNKWVPLILTSLIFGFLHIANPEVSKLGYEILFIYIGTGFFLGVLTLMDEGLELALGFHAANNLITALLVTADWTAFQTDSVLKDISDPILGADVFVPLLVVYPILLFVFSRIYKWTNWKEKLFGKVEKPVIFRENYRVIDDIGA